MKTMFPENLGLLGKVMDLRLERQNLAMSNMANMDVPTYRPRTLEFEKELQSALGNETTTKMTRTKADHMPTAFSPATFSGEESLAFEPHVVAGLDSVNLEKEMSTMAKNTLMYNALVDITKSDLQGVQRALTEGVK